jgi:hypothetical protein
MILKSNIIFFFISTFLMFLSFQNVNLFEGFILDIHEGFGGSEMRISQDVNITNLYKYLLEYYNFSHIHGMALYYFIALLIITLISFLVYILLPFLLYFFNSEFGIKYLFACDSIYSFLVFSLLIIIMLYPIIGHFIKCYDFLFIMLLIIIRLFQYRSLIKLSAPINKK